MNGAPIEQWEIDFIKENFLRMSDFDMSRKIGRSIYSVKHLRNINKLFRDNSPIPYTNKEINFIRLNYKSMSDEMMAEKLGRTLKSLYGVRYRLKLKRERAIKSDSYLVQKRVKKMQELIQICETTKSPYRLGLAKDELKKLSGL